MWASDFYDKFKEMVQERKVQTTLGNPFVIFLIALSYRWFKKLEEEVNDAPSKSLQRRMGLEVVSDRKLCVDRQSKLLSQNIPLYSD